MAELETTVNESTETVETEVKPEVETTTENAEIAKLRADLAKQKAAFDKTAKELGDTKKALRAKQSAEEVAAEEAREVQASMLAELEQLRKEKAVSVLTAKAMPFIGSNETAAEIAEYLYGAEDADAALTAIQKAWTAKEKALRLEYGKIPAPGVGSAEGPTVTKEQLNAMSYSDRLKFKNEHLDEYRQLMGR